MLENIIILIGIILIGLLIYLITRINGSIQKLGGSIQKIETDIEEIDDDDSKRQIKNIEDTVKELRDNITEFKDPMRNLNAFMIGSAQAGNFAEWNLKSIISDFLPEEMVEKNWKPNEAEGKNVEIAIKLANNLFLPIDSKNPTTDYRAYQEAIEKGDSKAVKDSKSALIKFVEKESAKINSKYIVKGKSTDIAYMYIPSENCVSLIYGLEKNNELIPERIFSDHKVMIVGPNMLATLLTQLLHNQERINISKKAEKIMEQVKSIEDAFLQIKDRQRITKVNLNTLKTSINNQDDNIEDLEETIETIKSGNDE